MPTKEEIIKVAKSARINLTDQELNLITNDANNILDSFNSISELDTSLVEPSFQPIRVENVLREDIVRPSISQEEALSQTPHKKDGYFRGPKVT